MDGTNSLKFIGLSYNCSVIRKTFARLSTAILVLLMWTSNSGIASTGADFAIIYDERSFDSGNLIKGVNNHLQKVNRKLSYNIIDISKLTDANLKTKLAEQYRVLVPVGSDVMLRVIKLGLATPLFVLDAERTELKAWHDTSNKVQLWISGIYRDLKTSLYTLLIKSILPSYNKVGLLLSEKNKFALGQLKREIAKSGLTPVIKIVRSNELPQRVLAKLANEVDVILTLNDKLVFNQQNMKSHLLTAFRNQVPIISTVNDSTDIGAFAVINNNYTSLGEQLAATLLTVLADIKKTPLISHPDDFTLRLNANVLRSYGVTNILQSEVVKVLRSATESKD
ncbi:MAG: ABC transporter substrate binding protein [Kangiellaceae bacterium]|jgi:hypothetical protein|nr:ABC transporter substrate binding protein [Kangiellaceae bacterium]